MASCQYAMIQVVAWNKEKEGERERKERQEKEEKREENKEKQE